MKDERWGKLTSKNYTVFLLEQALGDGVQHRHPVQGKAPLRPLIDLEHLLLAGARVALKGNRSLRYFKLAQRK